MEAKQPATLRELLRQLDQQGIYDYRRYRAMRRFLGFRAREKNQPISGTFELTPLCNLDCKMCYVHLQREQLHGAALLPVDRWMEIMRQAIDAGMLFAALTGGECLTYPGFRDLYRFLRDRGVEVSILSNGLLMDAEMVEFLKRNPPAAIQITVYGASEEAYERVTGKRAFARVMQNVRALRDAELPLCIAVTPNAYMRDGAALLRLLHGEGLPFSINAGLMQPRAETGRALADAGLDAYVDLRKLARELKGEAAEPECDPDALPDGGGAQKIPERGVRCGAGRSGFSIDWQGGMKPCNTFPCKAQPVNALGFAEAWRRTNQTALNFPRPAECEGCGYQGVCKACVSEHAAGAAPGHASPAICAWGKRMVAEGLLKLQRT